jgi:hypothetical protein
VITGVVDTSFGVFRSLLPGTPDPNSVQADAPEVSAPWNASRPGFGLLRREKNGFSIANIAASLPGRGGVGARGTSDDAGQQMVAVSAREPLIRSGYAGNEGYADEYVGDEEQERGSEYHPPSVQAGGGGYDVRSIESMMRTERGALARKSLTDRLAQMPGLSKLGPGQRKVNQILCPCESWLDSRAAFFFGSLRLRICRL